MKASYGRAVLVLGAVGLLVCVVLCVRVSVNRQRVGTGPFDRTRAEAFAVIRQRATWPESPADVCKAFWDARIRKDYAEMEVLWPGSASFLWPDICETDSETVYVFGEASPDGTRVPYASKGYFEQHGTYNLTMHLRVLQTDKGPRYYVVSG